MKIINLAEKLSGRSPELAMLPKKALTLQPNL